MSLIPLSINDLYFTVVIVLHFGQWILPRKLLYGVKQFNLEPSRGLKYLEEAAFVTDDPESVAKFLFRQERLSKRQIGEEENNKFISFEPTYFHTIVVKYISQNITIPIHFHFQITNVRWKLKIEERKTFYPGKYLGSHQEFNQEVLRHFVGCHQFEHLLLVQVGFDLLGNILFIIFASRPGASPVSLELQVHFFKCELCCSVKEFSIYLWYECFCLRLWKGEGRRELSL